VRGDRARDAEGAVIPGTWRAPGAEVAVVGLGRSGVAATRLLARDGVRVYASDAAATPGAAPALDELRALAGVTVQTGGHDFSRIRRAAAVVVSPGVPPEAPALSAAREAGVAIVSELDLGWRALRDQGTRCIAITGTNGKTTTTALIAHVLQSAGVVATAAGNIGRPLADLAAAGARPAWLAVEVSSFQLHDSPTFAPEVGVLTNLAPDHLDRYPDLAAYYGDKRLLFRNARPSDSWVLNGDDPAVLDLARGAPGHAVRFSLGGPVDAWYDASARTLRLGDAPLLARDDLHLLGDHNVANALAAALAVRAAGVAADAIAAALRTFRALPHRLEPVRDAGGVLWINDSKATNVASTRVALAAMDRPFVLLLGGRHKGEPYTALAPLLAGRCRGIVAYGEAGDLIERDLSGAAPLERGGTFDDVVARAARRAQAGDAVLLSPACSSYDMFRNYEERGARFRALAEAR
jgi:UDP-N-acetylmuramoylalanine--D-glutamate ligase